MPGLLDQRLVVALHLSQGSVIRYFVRWEEDVVVAVCGLFSSNPTSYKILVLPHPCIKVIYFDAPKLHYTPFLRRSASPSVDPPPEPLLKSLVNRPEWPRQHQKAVALRQPSLPFPPGGRGKLKGGPHKRSSAKSCHGFARIIKVTLISKFQL